MKKRCMFLFSVVALLVASCSNGLEDVQTDVVPSSTTRSVEPRFTGENLTESQAKALMNKFLDAPYFFYFQDVIGFDPETAISGSYFSVTRDGSTIDVRSIQVGVIGKNGKYGVYGTPTQSKEFYSLNSDVVLHGEPIYEESDIERANPVGMRYYYTTNDKNSSQNCWIAIDWEDAPAFERIIGW